MRASRGFTRIGWVSWAAALLCLGIVAVPVSAREVLRRSFGKSLLGPAEVASLQVSLAGARQGGISFDVQRRADAAPEWRRTIFALTPGPGDLSPFFMQVRWASEIDAARPMLFLRGRDFWSEGVGLWNYLVLLDRPVPPGTWIHVDLTWDDASRRYEIWVDGRPQGAEHLDFDPKTLKAVPDPRLALNREQRDAGLSPGFRSEQFSRIIRRVTAVEIGPHTELGRPRHLLSNNVVDNLVVRVDEVPPPGAVGPSPGTLAITEVTHDAARVAGFSGRLVAGNTLTATLKGTPGASASFDVARLPADNFTMAVDWRGWGVYLEEKSFFDEGEVNLRDVRAYRVYLSTEPFPVVPPGEVDAAAAAGATLIVSGGTTYRFDGEPLKVIDDVQVQSYLVEGLEIGVPYYVAVAAVMDDQSLRPVLMPRTGVPMTETADDPGAYGGALVLDRTDDSPETVLVGRLSRGDASASLVSEDAIEIDTALRIDVTTQPNELKADEKSTSKVTVTVTDANGDEVTGHKIKFLLATTSQYTGVVGGGKFSDEVGGSLDEDFEGTTDLFGQVTVAYTAGFAAKTAIIVARDMASNDTGAGYVKTYIQAAAELQLEPTEPVAATEMGYAIEVTSSDEWLTADGESEARITARVTLNDEPVEGHRVSFEVSSGTGAIKVVQGATGKDGKARALYTAGKKIGIVLITATDTTIGLSGSVQIELRSDAPAKIRIRITPEKLPADGRSRADLLVLVTDINDNPNDGAGIEYAVVGGGRVNADDEVTDKNGEAEATYTAGRNPGRVTIEVTVRSTVPGEEELKAARALTVAVPDYAFH